MHPEDFQKELDDREAEKKAQDSNDIEVHAINKAGIKNVEATNTNTRAVVGGVKAIKAGVKVTNPDLAKTADVKEVIDAIHKSNLTAYMANKGLPELADNLSTLNQRTQDLQDKVADEGLALVVKALDAVVKQLTALSKSTGNAQVTVDKKLQSTIDNLTKQIGKIDFNPSVNVSAPETKVIATPVDFAPILKTLQAIQTAIEDKETPDNRPDLDPVISGLSAVQNAITSLRFPVPNYVLPFKDINGKDVQVQLDASGNLPTSGGSGGGGTQYTDGAAAATHPIGTQQVFTNGSSIVTAVSTANPLPVSATFSGTVTSSPTFAQNPGAGTPTPAFGLVDSSFRPQVSVATALPAGTNVIGHVITDTGSTTAVTQTTSPWVTNDPGIPDTLGQKTMAGSTGVVLASDQASIPVAATLSAETTKVIGTVNQGTSPWVVSSTPASDAVTTGTITTPDAVVGAPGGSGATVSGSSTAGSLVALAVPSGSSSWMIQTSGTFGGTSIYFEASADSTNGTNGTWISVNGRLEGINNSSIAQGVAGAAVARGTISSFTYIRARAVGGSGLTIAVRIETSTGVGGIFLNASLPVGTNAIGSITNTSFVATQATASSLNATVVGTGAFAAQVTGTVTANAGTNLNTSALALDATLTGGTQRSKITDGTNNAAVKAASTAAATTDPALVVAISPNNTVPVSLATNTPTLQAGSTTAVTQATAANLNATVVGTGTFVTQATLAAETTKVIGTVNQGTSPWVVGGVTASGSSLTANPLTAGGLAKTANPTAVADGQVVNSLHDKLGKQVVVGSVRDLKADVSVTLTSTTAETSLITAIASTFNDVYGVIINNTSATATSISFRDVAAGTVRFSITVPAGDTRGFMLPESAAWKQATVNTAWTIQSSVSVASVIVSAQYVKNI